MNKRVAIILVCTFLALVAATAWVPVEPRTFTRYSDGPVNPARGWTPITGHLAPTYQFDWAWHVGVDACTCQASAFRDFVPGDYPFGDATIRWPWLAVEVLLIVSLGGLLALFFRTRAARCVA